MPFLFSRPSLFRNDNSSSSSSSTASSSALTISSSLSESSPTIYAPPLSKSISILHDPSRSPTFEEDSAAIGTQGIGSSFFDVPESRRGQASEMIGSPGSTLPHSPSTTPILLSPPAQHRPRLSHFSLSSLSTYHSRPTRRSSTPIPPSLIGTNIIDSLNSPFHFRAVEGRKWSVKKDGGGEARAGKKQTEKRSSWADDVLGVLETREER